MISHIEELKKKLKDFYSLQLKKNLFEHISIYSALLCISILIVCTLELIGHFSSSGRTLLYYVLVILITSFLLYIVIKIIKNLTLLEKADYISLAKQVGTRLDNIKDELANALQLVEEKENRYSRELIEAAFEEVYKKTKDANFNSLIDFSKTKKVVKVSALIFLMTLILIAFVPQLKFASYRIINYKKDFSLPPKFYFEIQPQNKSITKGDSVSIIIKTIGVNPSEVFLFTRREDESEFTSKKLLPLTSGIFQYNLSTVTKSFEYYASSENIRSNVYKITVTNRPLIKTFTVEIIPPAYSNSPLIIQKDNGNITTLLGSKVKLKLNSSLQLSKAILVFSDSSQKNMLIKNNDAYIDFNVTKETQYKMIIYDLNGTSNEDPITYSINIINDEYPSVEIFSPEENLRVNTDKVFLKAKIRDDYGFTKFTLNYRLSSSKYRKISDEFSSINIPINKKVKEDEIYFTWDLSPLVLAEGEIVSYYLEVFDNDNIKGPKSSRTKLYTIQVPSINDLFAEAEKATETTAKELNNTLKEAEELKKEIQKISNDLKQNKREISWEEKERVEKAAEKFKNLVQKAEEISQKLTEMQNNLLQNNLLSEETLKKYEELQKLLDEMTSDELKEAFRKLQEALKSLTRDNIQISFEELKANEEYFKQSIERTINLLKRVQVEQKIDELLKRTEELAKKIEDIKNKTEQSNLSDKFKRDELSEHQKNITNDLENLKQEMEKLSNKMNELDEVPTDKLKKAIEEFEKQKNQEISKEALKSIQQMQKASAIENQKLLSANMMQMKSHLESLQSAMQQMNQIKTFTEMMKILDDLLTLSDMQEKLKNETFKLNYYSQEFSKNSRKQSELQNNLSKILNKMSELSQKTFAITPEMGKALGRSFSEMQNAIGALQNRNGALASQYQSRAMENLNKAASLIKGSMSQMMNGGQGGGMISLFQQMQQVIQQQMNLNQLTQMLNQGKFTQEYLSQLQRLASEQELIRKSLEQLNKEAQESGKSKTLAANLEKILEEMKEVVKNLETEKLNDELVKQQERILSRLLDAQRSINERDYEKQRKAFTGKNIERESPKDFTLTKEERKNKLREELQKAFNEGYKKDYEELIRKYFEALEKEK
ncbi:MAG: hypothetical protein N2249_00490 [Melioribacter sp.]|nr:hypothetical protein [Melioribacter sp.]